MTQKKRAFKTVWIGLIDMNTNTNYQFSDYQQYTYFFFLHQIYPKLWNNYFLQQNMRIFIKNDFFFRAWNFFYWKRNFFIKNVFFFQRKCIFFHKNKLFYREIIFLAEKLTFSKKVSFPLKINFQQKKYFLVKKWHFHWNLFYSHQSVEKKTQFKWNSIIFETTARHFWRKTNEWLMTVSIWIYPNTSGLMMFGAYFLIKNLLWLN